MEESLERKEGDWAYGVLSMIDACIQFTNLNIKQVYELSADEFFGYVNYISERNRREKEEIQKIRRS